MFHNNNVKRIFLDLRSQPRYFKFWFCNLSLFPFSVEFISTFFLQGLFFKTYKFQISLFLNHHHHHHHHNHRFYFNFWWWSVHYKVLKRRVIAIRNIEFSVVFLRFFIKLNLANWWSNILCCCCVFMLWHRDVVLVSFLIGDLDEWKTKFSLA